jgi:biopolymer transport protein ExbD
MDDFDTRVRQTFVITMAAFFLIILLVFITITPLGVPGVFPLLDPVKTSRDGNVRWPYDIDVIISIDVRGRLYVEETLATPQEVEGAIRRMAEPVVDWRGETHERTVFVRVDKQAPFGAVRNVVRAARNAGRTRLVFLARLKKV